jgi:hypothetical protein
VRRLAWAAALAALSCLAAPSPVGAQEAGEEAPSEAGDVEDVEGAGDVEDVGAAGGAEDVGGAGGAEDLEAAAMAGGVPPDVAAAMAGAAGPAGAPVPGSFDAAQEVLRLEMELETVQMNPLFFFGGGFLALGGVVGTASSAAWLADSSDNVDGPVAALVATSVVAAVGLVLVALGVVDKIDVDQRRADLEQRRARLGTPATGMFRVGLGAGGELRIR